MDGTPKNRFWGTHRRIIGIEDRSRTGPSASIDELPIIPAQTQAVREVVSTVTGLKVVGNQPPSERRRHLVVGPIASRCPAPRTPT